MIIAGFSGSIAMDNSFNLSDWTPPASGLDAAAEGLYNKPPAWKPCASGDDWQMHQRRSTLILPDDSVHKTTPVNPKPATHFTDINLSRTLDEDLAGLNIDAPKIPQEDTAYHHFSSVLDDHVLNSSWDTENLIREEQCIVEDKHCQWQTHHFQATDAMDFDSTMHNGQPLGTVASPDLSTGTCVQLLPACLRATFPLSSAPLQLETPLINNLTGAVHTGLPASLPRDAQRPQASPQTVQQELLAPAHARPANARGQSDARGRSCSPKRPAKRNARQTKKNKFLAEKNIHQTRRKTGAAKRKGGQEKKSLQYLGVSYNSLNRKWRTTVSYKDAPRHMGYHDENKEEEAARQYDELALVVWNGNTESNFPIDEYPDIQTLKAKWLPVLEAKVAAQKKRQR